MGVLAGWPADAETAAADADARHLRALYGVKAEAWCAAALAALAQDDARRQAVQKIARALRAMPIADETRLDGGP